MCVILDSTGNVTGDLAGEVSYNQDKRKGWIMNWDKIQRDANKLHENARLKYSEKKPFKYDGVTYYIRFLSDGYYVGCFEVTGGEFKGYPMFFNTRKINTAKREFREWMEN